MKSKTSELVIMENNWRDKFPDEKSVLNNIINYSSDEGYGILIDKDAYLAILFLLSKRYRYMATIKNPFSDINIAEKQTVSLDDNITRIYEVNYISLIGHYVIMDSSVKPKESGMYVCHVSPRYLDAICRGEASITSCMWNGEHWIAGGHIQANQDRYWLNRVDYQN